MTRGDEARNGFSGLPTGYTTKYRGARALVVTSGKVHNILQCSKPVICPRRIHSSSRSRNNPLQHGGRFNTSVSFEAVVRACLQGLSCAQKCLVYSRRCKRIRLAQATRKHVEKGIAIIHTYSATHDEWRCCPHPNAFFFLENGLIYRFTPFFF